jgi:hypothetical protein
MNNSLGHFARKAPCRMAALVGFGLWLTSATAENQPAPNQAVPAPKPVAQVIPIPKSVYVVPVKPEEGTDPFFPKAARVKAATPSTTPRSFSGDLVLKGFSGPAQHKLAIINNYTLATGEEADLHIGAAHVHVRCIEVKADSVVIEIEGERRELRLRQSF